MQEEQPEAKTSVQRTAEKVRCGRITTICILFAIIFTAIGLVLTVFAVTSSFRAASVEDTQDLSVYDSAFLDIKRAAIVLAVGLALSVVAFLVEYCKNVLCMRGRFQSSRVEYDQDLGD